MESTSGSRAVHCLCSRYTGRNRPFGNPSSDSDSEDSEDTVEIATAWLRFRGLETLTTVSDLFWCTAEGPDGPSAARNADVESDPTGCVFLLLDGVCSGSSGMSFGIEFWCNSLLFFFGLSLDGSSRIGPFFHGGGSGDFVGELLVPYNEEVVREERRLGVPLSVVSPLGIATFKGLRDLRGDRRVVACEADTLKWAIISLRKVLQCSFRASSVLMNFFTERSCCWAKSSASGSSLGWWKP